MGCGPGPLRLTCYSFTPLDRPTHGEKSHYRNRGIVLDEVAAASEAALRSLGFRLGAKHGDSWSFTLPNSRPAVRTLRGDRGRITLSEARKRGDQHAGERALLVAPSASPGVISAARLGRWDLLLWEGPEALINGVSYAAVGFGAPADAPRRRDRLGELAPATAPAPLPAGVAGSRGTPPGGVGPRIRLAASATTAVLGTASPQSGGRPAWTRWAVARLLLLRGPQPVGRLSDLLGVSRQAVGRALQQWGEWVYRGPDGAWAPVDPARLRAAWEGAYPGPGGAVSGWWHPLPPLQQARAAVVVAQREGAWPLVSGSVALQAHDVAGVAAQRASVLVRTGVDLASAGFRPVELGSATLVLHVPRDPTLWATATPATVAGEAVVIADTLIAAYMIAPGTASAG